MTENDKAPEPTSLTASAARRHWQPSRATLAARSLYAAEHTVDPDERRAAFGRYMDEFPPTMLVRYR